MGLELFVVFVLGGPGSGKGTQSQNLVQEYGFKHLSAGDLLRKEMNNTNSQNGLLISDCIKEGKIVPMEVTIQLLKDAINEEYKKSNTKLFLIDGFPRKLDQAEAFENTVCVSQGVLFYDCNEQVMCQRLLKRGETSGRTDDNIESIQKRLVTYKEETLPVIDFYNKSNRVHKIEADGDIQDIYSQTKAIIEDLIQKSNIIRETKPNQNNNESLVVDHEIANQQQTVPNTTSNINNTDQQQNNNNASLSKKNDVKSCCVIL